MSNYRIDPDMVITMPMPFPGTADERAANAATHHFICNDPDGFDARCAVCDCRPWGAVSAWPCGAEPPRVEARAAESPLLRHIAEVHS